MTDQPGTALAVLAQIRAQARAGADALDGLNRAVEALEGIIQEGLEGPFNGVFNALPSAAIRTHQRGKIEQDPELQAFIRARCLTLPFPEVAAQVAAQVAAHFPPDRRVTTSSMHRWWHRRGKKTRAPNG
jgi:hypothetical protein